MQEKMLVYYVQDLLTLTICKQVFRSSLFTYLFRLTFFYESYRLWCPLHPRLDSLLGTLGALIQDIAFLARKGDGRQLLSRSLSTGERERAFLPSSHPSHGRAEGRTAVETLRRAAVAHMQQLSRMVRVPLGL